MSPSSDRQSDGSRKTPRLWQLAALAVLLGSTAYGTLRLDSSADHITALWPCNGLLLGVLLLAPRRHWISYFGVGFAVDLGVNSWVGVLSMQQTLFSLCNMVETLVALLTLRSVLPRVPDLTRMEQLIKFLLLGVVFAPAVGSLLAGVIATFFGGGIFPGYGPWFGADALGMATMTPLYLTLSRHDLHADPLAQKNQWEVLGLFLMIVIVSSLVFDQDKYPLLFLILPVLLLAGVRLGFAGASFSLIIVSILGGTMTSLGHGPVALVPHASTGQHILVFQFFIATSMLMLYGTEVMTRRNNALQQAVATSEARFRLLTETSRDIILLSDLEGRRKYVSPAVTELLGWEPEALLAKTYHDIVHPEDIELSARLLDDCRKGLAPQSASYRCRKLDGSYLWVETTIRLYHDPESSRPVGVVSVMRDISGRKAAEEELQAAYKAVEALAIVDSLTGVANRRRLDQVLLLEWRRAARDRKAVSLLMFDVDYFKAYNDFYGHVQGDECLRQIAEAAIEVIRRPGDLIARFGGEEFAVILPNTDSEGSREIAEELRRTVEERALPHTGNAHGIITVSIGSATMMPVRGSDYSILLEAADKALYQAKHRGRNQVQSAALRYEFNKKFENEEAEGEAENTPAIAAEPFPLTPEEIIS